MTEQPPFNPYELETLRLSVEGSIRKAFAHVRRGSGVSWSEADVIDDYGTAEQRAKARLQDKDTNWDQLVDDPRWNVHGNSANFTFLDGPGQRYYLPPIMIRAMRSPPGRALDLVYCLVPPVPGFPVDYLNEAQARAVARYIFYMLQRARLDEQGHGHSIESNAWKKLLDYGWGAFLNEPSR